MARVDIPVDTVPISRFALTSALAAQLVAGDTANGMRMVNNGSTLLMVASSSGVQQTVSPLIVESIDFQVPPAPDIPIPANTVVGLLGPFPINIYGSVLEFDVSSNLLDFTAFSLI